mmetsp:Transcript_65545/g.142248  ORF Transcript_65545/g.142248 Transcript_65545/m.142248 type:complete len:640 (-) Transcript_65545:186-2105(-)
MRNSQLMYASEPQVPRVPLLAVEYLYDIHFVTDMASRRFHASLWRMPVATTTAAAAVSMPVPMARCHSSSSSSSSTAPTGCPSDDQDSGLRGVKQFRQLKSALAATAATAGAPGLKCSTPARCDGVDPKQVLDDLFDQFSKSSPWKVKEKTPSDRDVDSLMSALRGSAQSHGEEPKSGLAWLKEIDASAMLSATKKELDMVTKVLCDHFGNCELAQVHPLAVRYMLAENSKLRTPAVKEKELMGAGGRLLNADLSADAKLFADLLEHCKIADVAYSKSLAEVKEVMSSIWTGWEWDVPVFVSEARPGKPAHLLVVRKPDKEGNGGRVVLAVRGTHEVADVLTDALMDTHEFENGYAHAGVVRAATDLCEMYGKYLSEFEEKGYEIVIEGHSLGAAVAAVVAIRLRKTWKLNTVRCICFAPPPSVDLNLAKEAMSYIISVVHDDDFIPRSQVASLLATYRGLIEFDWLRPALEEAEELLHSGPDWLKATVPPKDVLAKMESALSSRMEQWRDSRKETLEKLDGAQLSQEGVRKLLHLPGFIVHMVRADNAIGYRAAQSTSANLQKLHLSESMVFDHLLDGYKTALDALAKGGHQLMEEDAEFLASKLPVPEPLKEAAGDIVRKAQSIRQKVLEKARPDAS